MKLLKNILAYSGVNLVSQILVFGQNFVVRGFLAPQIMGIWNYVGVVQGFLSTFDLGINAAAFRELPLLRGQGQSEAEEQARATAFWSSLGQGLVFMSLILLYLALGWENRQHRISLLVAAVLVASGSLKDCLVTFIQGAQQYIPLSRIMFATAVLQAGLVSLGAYLGGIYGLMAAAVTVQVLQVLMLRKTCTGLRLAIHHPWNWRIFRRQTGFGLPLRLVDYPMSLLVMLDVLCITKFFSVGALALYITGRMISLAVTEIIARMGTVIITRINERGATPAGRVQVAEELRLFLFLEYLVLLPAVICLAYFTSSFLIAQFIPQYFPAVEVAQILLMSLFFVPQTTLVRNFWILDKRLVSLGISNVVGLLAGSTILLLATWNFGLSLKTVAWATVGGMIIYHLYIMFSAGRETWGLGWACGLGLSSLGSAACTAMILNFLSLDFLNLDFLHALQMASFRIMASLLLLSPLFLLGAWLLLRSKAINLREAVPLFSGKGKP